jgi:hypothetical protein
MVCWHAKSHIVSRALVAVEGVCRYRVPYHFPLVTPRRSLCPTVNPPPCVLVPRGCAADLECEWRSHGPSHLRECAGVRWILVSHGLSECWLNMSWQRLRHKSELRSEREHHETLPD